MNSFNYRLALLALVLIIPCLVEAQIEILHNHLGYETLGVKKVVFQGKKGDSLVSFQLIDFNTKGVVYTEMVSAQGSVDSWRDWIYWTGDFTSFNEPGDYIIECTSNGVISSSFPFEITTDSKIFPISRSIQYPLPDFGLLKVTFSPDIVFL